MDTITNWQFYLNDSLLFADNVYHIDFDEEEKLITRNYELVSVRLAFDDLEENDEFIVRYHTCTSYKRMKKMIVRDMNFNILYEEKIEDNLGFLPFVLSKEKLKQFKGKGILVVEYDEYINDDELLKRRNGVRGYSNENIELGRILIK